MLQYIHQSDHHFENFSYNKYIDHGFLGKFLIPICVPSVIQKCSVYNPPSTYPTTLQIFFINIQKKKCVNRYKNDKLE